MSDWSADGGAGAGAGAGTADESGGALHDESRAAEDVNDGCGGTPGTCKHSI